MDRCWTFGAEHCTAMPVDGTVALNTDQGAQFTSDAFTGRLEAENIPISMDGRGRALDNVFVERLWRTVKYEDVYLKDYSDPPDAVRNLAKA